MTGRQSVLQNFRWLAGANFAVKPVWFLFILMSTRVLGPEEFGRFMFALSFVAVVTYFFEGGVDMYTMRELSRGPGAFQTLLPQTLFLKGLLGVGVAVVGVAASLVLGFDTRTVVMIAMAGGHGLLNSVLVHARFVFRAFEKMKYEAVSILIEKVVIVAMCGVSFLVSRTAGVFMMAFVASYFLATSATLLMLWTRVGKLSLRIDWCALWPSVFRPALPFALMGIFMVVYFRAGTLMIQWITGSDTSVGYYGAGYRIVEAFALIPTIVVMPLYATFVRGEEDPAMLRGVISRAVRGLLALALVPAVPFILFHQDMTSLIFGADYLPASWAIGLTVLTVVPVGLTWLFVNLAGAIGRQRTLNFWIVGVTLVNLGLNYVLIHAMGVLGAAVTTLISECLMALAAIWVVRRYIDGRRLLLSVASAAASVVAVWAIVSAGVLPAEFIPRLVIAMILLVAGLFLTRLVTVSEARKVFGR